MTALHSLVKGNSLLQKRVALLYTQGCSIPCIFLFYLLTPLLRPPHGKRPFRQYIPPHEPTFRHRGDDGRKDFYPEVLACPSCVISYDSLRAFLLRLGLSAGNYHRYYRSSLCRFKEEISKKPLRRTQI